MGCGCNKGRSVTAPPSARSITSPAQATSVTQFDVHDNSGGLVASFSSSVAARSEARRVNGTVVPKRVTSTEGAS